MTTDAILADLSRIVTAQIDTTRNTHHLETVLWPVSSFRWLEAAIIRGRKWADRAKARRRYRQAHRRRSRKA